MSKETLKNLFYIIEKNKDKSISDIYYSLFKDLDLIDELIVEQRINECYKNGCKV